MLFGGGQPVAFNVYAEDVNSGDSVRIYVLEDPGIPNGFSPPPTSLDLAPWLERAYPTRPWVLLSLPPGLWDTLHPPSLP